MVARRNIVRFLCGVLALTALHLGSSVAVAATVTWDGGAGTTNWNTATNWSGDALPTGMDDVVIGGDAAVVVTSGGPDVAVASLDVYGDLQTHEPVVASGPIRVRSGGAIDVETCPWLRSISGLSIIDIGGTLETSCLIRFDDLQNSGTILVHRNGLSIDDEFESAGLVSGSGSISAARYLDTGVTSFQGVIQSNDGTLAGTHSICSLYGTWHVTTGELVVPKTCQLHFTTFTLDATGSVTASVHATLTEAGNPPIEASGHVQLDGTIHVLGDWGNDLTPAARTAVILRAASRGGTPTITTPPGFATGPSPWTATVSWSGSYLRAVIAEPIPPSGVGVIERRVGGSRLHAAWSAATDAHGGIKGYSVVVDQVADTIPDAVSETTSTEYAEYPAPGTYYVHVRAIDTSGNAGPTSHSGPWEVHAPGEWSGLGATNDWHDPSNWIANIVPAPGADVTITTLDPDAPVGPRISSDVTAGVVDLAAPLTIDAANQFDAQVVSMSGPADLIGGAASFTDLNAWSIAPEPQMTTMLSSLRTVSVYESVVSIDGSIGPGSIQVSGTGAHLTVTGSVEGGVDVGEGTRIDVGSITVPAGSTLSALGAVHAVGTVSVAHDLTIESDFSAAKLRLLAPDFAVIGDGTPLNSDIEIVGGFVVLARDVDGNVDVADGALQLWDDDGHRVISGSFTVSPAAKLLISSPSIVQVGGAAQLDGQLHTSNLQPSTTWGVVTPLLHAAGGVNGSIKLMRTEAEVEPSFRVVLTATTMGITPVDITPPGAPALSASLGATTTAGTRTLSATWTPPDTDSSVTTSPIDGWSVAIDSSATTEADRVVDHGSAVRSSQFSVGPGTWYVHLRARDADGNWGMTAHAGPFSVTSPPGTTTDRCSNIPGVQEALPRRTSARVDGTCWTTASAGADQLWGSFRAELFRGGRGNDVVRARGGADRLYGDAGSDRLFGEAGNDRILGGAGRDFLYGGAGRDVIDARDRARGDVVSCGAGRDVAYLNRGDRAARDCERVLRS